MGEKGGKRDWAGKNGYDAIDRTKPKRCSVLQSRKKQSPISTGGDIEQKRAK
jgi:hypothetical protein